MSLATYKQKRNFKETSEPLPKIGKDRGARTFVIQRHKASRLHYDFRLEVNGVLKSWAVPKGPSLYPTDKRLAMMVEDHPLSYGSFKGTIPEGNYGAGIVEIWDKGTYEPEEIDNISDKAIDNNIKNGMLKFSLKGRKLKGSFALVRIRGAESKNWLLIKHRDKYATDDEYNSEDDTPANSPINKFLLKQQDTDTNSGKKSRTVNSNKSASRARQKSTAPKPNKSAAPVKRKSAAANANKSSSAAKKKSTAPKPNKSAAPVKRKSAAANANKSSAAAKKKSSAAKSNKSAAPVKRKSAAANANKSSAAAKKKSKGVQSDKSPAGANRVKKK
jgi:bifunctional non-homologous end joining protein LigD